MRGNKAPRAPVFTEPGLTLSRFGKRAKIVVIVQDIVLSPVHIVTKWVLSLTQYIVHDTAVREYVHRTRYLGGR